VTCVVSSVKVPALLGGTALRRTVSARLLLLVYAAVVVFLTVLPVARHRPAYWGGTPWWTSIAYVPFEVDLPSFVLNVIMFMPFGVLLPLVWRAVDGYWRMVALAAATSTGIEVIQLILNLTLGSRRTVDVNDVIANTAGALAGLLVLRLAVPNRDQRALLGRLGVRRPW
jgi:glycopeptide antibiotics resistance protein